MQPTVYLAGPIGGLSFDGCTDWRNWAIEQFADVGIKGLSPMRGKEYLKHLAEITGHGRDYFDLNVMSQPKSVVARDRFDATRCDVLLANFKGAKRVSIGTVMEIAWADLSRIPIVAVMDDDGLHDQMMLTEAVNIKTDTLEEAVHVVKVMLA